ncbi:unnamed protein product [Spirodela intermedia]|uniref:Uncharacterized protein n=1 Tax=Spirodela intermedia TaxID=51605 RepID=A0A7I8JWL7_SPIIN|nr:unnamed protein product [Spirodela intermedia]CAA6673862.1 unnamed protein product [Spirodela intermedia]
MHLHIVLFVVCDTLCLIESGRCTLCE